MHITVEGVVNAAGENLGVEIKIDDQEYFQLKDNRGLTGLRIGRIIPNIGEKFYYNAIADSHI